MTATTQGTGRRHWLTVMFTDLSGSTLLGRAIEPEHYEHILSAVREVCTRVAAVHGGQLVRAQGDGALIVFGHPEVNEDDGRRAGVAALDIHAQVQALAPPGLPQGFDGLRMHTGIHAGLLLLAPGDIERGRFDLVGDVANVAARLSQQARAGEVLASLDALGPDAHFFDFGDEPARLASETLRVLSLRGRSGVTRRYDATRHRGLTPFIGRTGALRRVHASIEAPHGEPVVLVTGPPGIGKTRLLEQLAVSLAGSGRLLLRGGCESYMGAEVLQPFVQMLRAQRLHGTRWDEVLAAMLELCGQEQPLILLDDWQWADEASRRLLDVLLRQGERRPFVVLASRPREDGRPWLAQAPEIKLQPFAQQETLRAVQRLAPQADPFLAAQIHEYAGGMPLFVEELCHSASVDALWLSLSGRGASGAWLHALVASRLARLDEALRQIVRRAAVIGNEVPLWLLALLCDQIPGADALHALADADFLYPSGVDGRTLRFKHGITRDAVYESIGLEERMALHRRLADALKPHEAAVDDAPLEALAFHSRGASAWDDACHYAELAGDKASVAFALDRARQHYQAALDALDRRQPRTREESLQWCALAAKLALTCLFDPLSLRNDLSVFERAVSVARTTGDAGALARSLYWHGYLCYGLGRLPTGLALLREALAAAEHAGDPRLAAQVRAALGQTLAAASRYDEALALLAEAVDAKRLAARPRGGSLAIGSAYALACQGSVLADRGAFDDAHDCFDQALSLLGDSAHPVGNSVRNWIGIACVWQGRWDDAERIAADSVRIAENTGALLLLAVSRSVAGWAAWGARQERAGLHRLREAMQWMQGRQGRFYTSLQHGWLAEGCVAVGAVVEARRHAAHAFWRARSGERLGDAVAARALALVAARQGQHEAAARLLARAAHSADLRDSARERALNSLARAQVALCQDQRGVAQGVFEEAVEALLRLHMPWHAERAVAWAHEAQLPLTRS